MLCAEAHDTLRLVRELRILEEADVRSLEQLFSNRPNDSLTSSLIRGREGLLSRALFRVATGASSTAVVGYVLRFLADLSQVSSLIGKEFGVENAVQLFGGAEPAASFMNLASTHESTVGILGPALHLVGCTLRHAAGDTVRFTGTLNRFFQFCNTRLHSNASTEENEFVIHALSQVVRRKALREHCFGESGVATQLPRVLANACAQTESASLIQTIYECLICTWLLSFECRGLVELYEAKAIPTVHRILQKMQKEKCVRMALMTLKNFALAQQRYYAWRAPESQGNAFFADPQLHLLGNINRGKGPSFFADMVGVGISKTLWQLARRKFGDEDIVTEVEELTALVDQNLDSITSFSEYKGEVQSGMLEWSPVHSSIKFWKENASKFEENGYEVLKDLAGLVLNSRNDVTLAVACHDVGELVRHHPTGRALLQLPQMRGVKERVMQHMSHQNSEVAKNALLAVQKIMVQKWEFIK